MFDHIANYCQQLEEEFDTIPGKRKKELEALSNYISDKYDKGEEPKLIVICTHNSRRSHLGQLWLAVGADYFGLSKIHTFSGGTEATAFNPRAVKAIKKAGFEVTTKELDSMNPKYQIRWNTDMDNYLAFSTRYDEDPNPKSRFGAIMVCTDADEKCPIVMGADFRLSLPYDDPKAFDDTPQESEKYNERCRQIGREMLYTISLLLD